MHLVSRIAVHIFCMALLLATAFGCAGRKDAFFHQEPDLPTEQSAIIWLTGYAGLNLFAAVDSINGKSTNRDWDWDQQAKLTPGPHKIGVTVHTSRWYQWLWHRIPLNISVNLKGGHSYRVHVRREGPNMRLWVKDEETEEVVGVTTLMSESGS